jgi:CheY-like chemotaxis protein
MLATWHTSTTVPAEKEGSTSKRHVLCAEDNQSVAILLRHLLEAAGYHVSLARDGVEAWEIINHQGIDLLVTDHDMPRLTGCDLIARVRDHGHDFPIILITGSLDTLASGRLADLKLSGILAKPFASSELLDALETAVKQTGVTA